MQTIPLIDTLLLTLTNKRPTVRQRSAFRTSVHHMNTQDMEKVYVIIYGWWLYYDNDPPKGDLPYGAEVVSSGVSFDYEKFPMKLKQILCKFAEKHAELAHEE